MRYVVAAICNKHGFHEGGDCPNCNKEETNQAFYTNRDKMYEFYSSALGKEIHSKTEWKRELKSRGLTDDFNQSWVGRKRDIEANASRQHSNRVHKHEEIKNSVREALKNMNMYSREKLFISKNKAPMGMRYEC